MNKEEACSCFLWFVLRFPVLSESQGINYCDFYSPPFHMHPFSEVKCKSLIWLISQRNLISEDLGKAADEDVSF